MDFTLTQKQACQFYVLWQGLSGPYRWHTQADILMLIDQLGCLQFDPIDICGRNADLVLQARVRGYRKRQLETLLYKDCQLIDALDKNMAIYPQRDYPKFARTRRRAMEYHRVTEQIETAIQAIKTFMQTHPILCSQDVNWNENLVWVWGRTASLAAVALEMMLYRGEVVIHHRQGTIRYYQLTEKRFPGLDPLSDPFPDETEYYAWRIERRIRALGLCWNRPSDAWLGIEKMKSAERQKAFELLLKQARIFPVNVEGWDQTLYAVSETRPFLENARGETPYRRRMEFLGPLDNALWDRRLIEQLFGFQYKWEIYTPKAQRKYDSYVLPVLWGDRFVGRISLESKPAEKKLIVKQFWREPRIRDSQALRTALDRTLERFMRFHECEIIERNE